MRRAAALLLALALLAGCSRPATPPVVSEPAPPAPAATEQPKAEPPKAESPKAESPKDAPVVPGGIAAEKLLPQPNRIYGYHLSDGSEAIEFYVADGERLIGSYNGKTYVTWFLTPEGVFRQDPKGPALLRYLPPDLKDDLAWKQGSGDAEVWFRAASRTNCYQLDHARECWELTVLNRQEQTRFQFVPGWGTAVVESMRLDRPAESYVKRSYSPQPTTAPDRETMLREGGRRPESPLPQVTPVTLAEFEQARQAMLRKGGALLEVDLDNDGKQERLEGILGAWHPGPLALYDDDGREVPNAFYIYSQSRVEIVSVPGADRPTLVMARGTPGQWLTITPRWMRDGTLYEAWGWHPKSTTIWGSAIRADGEYLAVDGVPAELAGYQWTRWYRVEPINSEHRYYKAELVREEWQAGPHPTEPADLLTAAFLARWWNLTDDLARYIPDRAVRDSFLAAELTRPPYRPGQAQLGKLSLTKKESWPVPIPELTPAPLATDGSTEFLVKVGLYEGYRYYAGRVTFAGGAGDRLVIKHLEITASEFVY
ncbi:MAG: hypothetical protein ACOY94_07530 [Bacillota bacterium]